MSSDSCFSKVIADALTLIHLNASDQQTADNFYVFRSDLNFFSHDGFRNVLSERNEKGLR